MAFWLVLALMTAAAIFVVMWPLGRRSSAITAGSDVAVYRDQLEEIDRDCRNGSIGPAEAEAARVEVSRRLIAAADANAAAQREGKVIGPAPLRARLVAVAILIALPVGSVAFYLAFGSPGLPGQPIAARIAAAHVGKTGVGAGPSGEDAAMAGLVARVEAYLQSNPDDGRGWDVLAPVYLRLGRHEDAVKAHRNAIRVLGSTPDREADLAEAMIMAAKGQVTPEAKTTLERASAANPDNVTARYYLGLAAEQEGKRDEAAGIWRGMLDRAPEGATWVTFIRKALARVDGSAPPAAQAQANPEALSPPEEVAPETREMARPMVERLAARLKENGSDVEGWLRLVRSYMVIAERNSARAAVLEARQVLANDADKLQRLDAGVKQLRLEGVTSVGDVAAALQGGSAMAKPLVGTGTEQPPQDAIHARPQTPGAAPHSSGNQQPDQSGASPPAPEHAGSAEDMVERLASRLRENGSDVEGWLMLLRSYVALGEQDKARAAVSDARRALASDERNLLRLDDAVKKLGLEG